MSNGIFGAITDSSRPGVPDAGRRIQWRKIQDPGYRFHRPPGARANGFRQSWGGQ
ncbi:hypothetical protein D3OALGA1CA_4619 [Olavius algarvensis associated proteobacterium Delta 3]|nr:hypothetical protein D3OALGA1CA_4619 [Olavius algarvensis associated proteobacterium Delta 3]